MHISEADKAAQERSTQEWVQQLDFHAATSVPPRMAQPDSAGEKIVDKAWARVTGKEWTDRK
jgi:hypothetical protein